MQLPLPVHPGGEWSRLPLSPHCNVHPPAYLPRYAVWMGKIMSPAEFVAKYLVDAVKYVDELDAHFLALEEDFANPPPMLYTLHGKNTDSGSYCEPATWSGIEKYRVDNGRLFPIIVELRVIKTPDELEVMRYVSDVTSKAHMGE
jgi:Xaa-Pro dipeptidase